MSTTIVVATNEELALLTAQEERVYRRYRHEGKKFKEIADELKIKEKAVRERWNAAMKKIRQNRDLTENPQYFIARGRDVLQGQQGYGLHEAPAETLRTIPALEVEVHPELMRLFEPDVRVRLRGNLTIEDEYGEEKELMTLGIIARVEEVFEEADPPYCVVEFKYDSGQMLANVEFGMMDPV